jgi:hypothetical protein
MIFSLRAWCLAATAGVVLAGPGLGGCDAGTRASAASPGATQAVASHPDLHASTSDHSAATPAGTGLTADDVTIGRRMAAVLMDAPGTATLVKLTTAQRAKMPPCINVPVGHACLVVRVDQHVRQGLDSPPLGAPRAVTTAAEAVMDATNGREVALLEAGGTTPDLTRFGVPVTTINVG